jgi:protein-tyrosine phosphatase
MFESINYIIAPLKILKDKVWDYTVGIDNKDLNEILGETPRIFNRVSTSTQCKYFFSEPTYIIDNIYLGSAYNAASFYKLEELNIGLIINVTNEISEYYPDDFSYKKYNLYDNNKDTIQSYLEKSYNDILNFSKNNKDKNILIHCFMGASRSVSIIIYYLLKKNYNNDNKFTIDDAIEFIKDKRCIINPTEKLISDIKLEMDINDLKNNVEK